MSSTAVSLTRQKALESKSPNTSNYAGPRSVIWTNSTPTVSVIIPLYNKEKYIGECVKSVLDQSFKDFELIIVNDGSTDKSSGSITRDDERIQIIHTTNHGAAYARNQGLERARAKYVMFVDADDYLEPEAIEKLVSAIPGMGMVVGSFRKVGAMTTVVQSEDRVRRRGEMSEYVMENLQDPSRNQLLSGCWGKLFRNDIIRKYMVHFPAFMRTAEDMGFNYSYLAHVNDVGFISDIVYNNRKHSDFKSLSTRFDTKDPYGLFGFVIGLNYVRKYLKDFYLETDIDQAIANSYIYHMILYFVRICGQTSFRNAANVVRDTIGQKEFKRRMKYYNPGFGNYRLIPWFLKKGWLWPTVLACRMKA